MYKETARIKPKVREKLKTSQDCRNSDRALILAIWRDEGLILDEKQQEIFKKVSNPETIRRNRQTIQNTEGKYLADDKIKKGREENRLNMEATHLRPRFPQRVCECGADAVYDEYWCRKHI